MKVWITRDWSDKTYEVWTVKPDVWNKFADYYDDGSAISSEVLIIERLSPKEAKSTFNLPRHLKKKEIAEGTMTFKVKVK